MTDAHYSTNAVMDTFPRTLTQHFPVERGPFKGPYPKVTDRIEIVWLDLKITDEIEEPEQNLNKQCKPD